MVDPAFVMKDVNADGVIGYVDLGFISDPDALPIGLRLSDPETAQSSGKAKVVAERLYQKHVKEGKAKVLAIGVTHGTHGEQVALEAIKTAVKDGKTVTYCAEYPEVLMGTPDEVGSVAHMLNTFTPAELEGQRGRILQAMIINTGWLVGYRTTEDMIAFYTDIMSANDFHAVRMRDEFNALIDMRLAGAEIRFVDGASDAMLKGQPLGNADPFILSQKRDDDMGNRMKSHVSADPNHVMITMPGHDHVLKAFGSTFAQSDGYKADHTSAVQRLAQAYGDAAVAQVLLVPDQQDLADHLVDGKMTADEWKGAAYPLIMPASMSGDVITMKGGFAPAEFDEAVYYDWR